MLKNIVGSSGWKLIGALALALFASTGALANPVTNVFVCEDPDPGGPDSVPCEATWVIGDASNPVNVTLDPWVKNLLGFANGDLLNTDPDDVRTLSEYALVTAESFNKWTETIDADWVWVSAGADGALFTINGVSWMDIGGSVTGFGTQTLTFTFDEQDPSFPDPGLDEFAINIQKSFMCARDEGCINGPTVIENAAPEPGTLLLLAAGLAGFGLRRRRNA